MYRSRLITTWLAALIVFAGSDYAFADSPSVTAVLSNSEGRVGQMVQLEIRIVGAAGAKPPRDIAADGLEIKYTGEAQESQITFGIGGLRSTSTVTYNYTILPLRPGRFTIPPQIIQVGGKSLRTPELTLNVADSPGSSSASRPSQGAQPGNTSKLVFAELIVPKKTAFVGEVMPVVIRVGFFVPGQIVDPPVINAQGFTMQKLQLPERSQVEGINGGRCEVYTFKTAIAATRQGAFDIGPAQANAVVLVPRQRQRSTRPRSPSNPFDADDFFNDPFFADPFGRFSQQEKLTVKSELVTLEVKPLPTGAPPGFSGAIGNFTMTTDAKPKSVQVGDPITVTSTITGRGNFDRVSAPVIEDERGWHKYPPSSKFAKDDDVGISGTKTFEIVLSPNEKKQSLPVMEFAYFDPVKEQYATMRSDPIAINVEGGAVAASPVPVPPGSIPLVTATKPAPAAKPHDILYQLTERPKAAQSFTPLYARPTFWSAQLIPLFALLGLIGWKIRQARIDNREAQRIAVKAERLRRGVNVHRIWIDLAAAGRQRRFYANNSRSLSIIFTW